MDMKEIKDYYPTETAVELAFTVKLYDTLQTSIWPAKDDSIPEYKTIGIRAEQANRILGDFQQSATIADFDDCLIFFEGFELNESQIKVLNLIYKFTRLKLKGDMVNVISSVIHSSKVQQKEYIEILLRLLDNPDSIDEKTAESTINFIVKEAEKEIKVTRGKKSEA